MLGLGVIVLLGRWLALRYSRLASAARRFPLLAAVLFALAGLALFAEGFIATGAPGYLPHAAPWFLTARLGLFAVPQGPGPRAALIASVVALTAAIAATGWGVIRSRRPRYIR